MAGRTCLRTSRKPRVSGASGLLRESGRKAHTGSDASPRASIHAVSPHGRGRVSPAYARPVHPRARSCSRAPFGRSQRARTCGGAPAANVLARTQPRRPGCPGGATAPRGGVAGRGVRTPAPPIALQALVIAVRNLSAPKLRNTGRSSLRSSRGTVSTTAWKTISGTGTHRASSSSPSLRTRASGFLSRRRRPTRAIRARRLAPPVASSTRSGQLVRVRHRPVGRPDVGGGRRLHLLPVVLR